MGTFALWSRAAFVALLALATASCGDDGDSHEVHPPPPPAAPAGLVDAVAGVEPSPSWLYSNVNNLSLNDSTGTTWEAGVAEFGQPLVRVDGKGRIHAVWSEGADSLWYTRGDSEGTSWQPPTLVVNDLYSSPAMGVGTDGTVAVAWITSNPLFGGTSISLRVLSPTASTGVLDASSGVTQPSIVDELGLNINVASSPRVLVDAGGVVHVLWMEHDAFGAAQVWHRSFNPAAAGLSYIQRVTDGGLAPGTAKNDWVFANQFTAQLDTFGNLHVLALADVDDDSDDRGDMDGLGPDATGVTDPADDGVDRRGLRYRRRAAGAAGSWSATSENPLPGTLWPPSAAVRSLEAVHSADLMTDDAGRVHVVASADRGQGASSKSAFFPTSGPDDLFYTVRTPDGAWDAVDAVSRSADVPGGDVPLLDDTNRKDSMACAVNPVDGSMHVVWADRTPSASGDKPCFIRHKKRTVYGPAFAAQLSTTLDSLEAPAAPRMGRMECGIDPVTGDFTAVYDRHVLISKGWWFLPDTTRRDLYAAMVPNTAAYSLAGHLRKLNPNDGQNGDVRLEATGFKYGRTLVLWSRFDPLRSVLAPYVMSKAAGSAAWSPPMKIDAHVEARNGNAADGWGGRAAVALTPARFHVFFDQFATHPGPMSANEDFPDTNPGQYFDPNGDPDSYDLFHIRTP